jgi:hypothetical protein
MNLKSIGIRYGWMAGVVTIIIYFIAYLIDKTMFIQSSVLWLSTMAIYLIAMRLASIETRKAFFANPDTSATSYKFSHAIQPAFVVFLIAQIIYVLFQFLMIRVIDPSLIELTREIAIEQLDSGSKWYLKFLPEDALEAAKDQVAEQDFTPKISNTILGLAFSLLGGFLIACIYGLVFRKNIEELN